MPALILGGPAFWNAIVGGITAGSIYALVAYGYSLVFLATDVFNFAQGDLVSIGAIIGYTLLVSLGSPAVLALVGAILFAGAVGAGEWIFFVAPVIRRGTTLAWLVTTLAFSIIVENVLIQAGWAGQTFRTFQWPFGSKVLHIGGAAIPPAYIGAFVSAVVVAILLGIVFGRTMFGKAMLAMAEDREAARVRGVSVLRFATVAFGLGGMLSGLAGFIVAPSVTVSYSLGNSLGLKAFVALALGGFGNPRAALVGGLAFGLIEAQVALYIAGAWVDGVDVCILVALLALFPGGISRRVATRTI